MERGLALPDPDTEVYVSVDVETAGPHPSLYSLLSIGACLVNEPERAFYVQIKPVNMNVLPEAMKVNGLSLERLAREGEAPERAMTAFADWLAAEVPNGRPVFVAFNAPFDWMFVNDYFHRYLGRNPFGHAALDIKAFYMGLTNSSWAETSMAHVTERYLDAGQRPLTHHALQDARDQAELFRRMLADAWRSQVRD